MVLSADALDLVDSFKYAITSHCVVTDALSLRATVSFAWYVTCPNPGIARYFREYRERIPSDVAWAEHIAARVILRTLRSTATVLAWTKQAALTFFIRKRERTAVVATDMLPTAATYTADRLPNSPKTAAFG